MNPHSDLSTQAMTVAHKERLTSNTVLIVNKLQDVEIVLEYLKEKNCLHEKTRQKIMAETTQWDKHQQLLSALKRGSEATFYVFLEALLETQDDADIYNNLCDDSMPSMSKSRTGPPIVGPAGEYYRRLRDFHQRKLQQLIKEKPTKYELKSYVQINMYSKQQGLSGMRTGFRESVIEAVQVLGDPIAPENLFTASKDETVPSKVLLLGAPGVGKSMTAYHFLSQNTQDKLWKEDIHFIIFIILNELNRMTQKISFEDILFNIYGPPVKNAQKILKYLQKDQGKVLFILDGYDEVDLRDDELVTFQRMDEKTKPQQLIYNLISRNILPDSKVLVTGRPHILQKLQSQVDREVELLGLDRDKLNEMTHRELADHPGLVKDVIDYFDSHPNVATLCSVPVNAKRFLDHVKLVPRAAHLYESLPHSKAGLLFMIVLNLLCHHDKLLTGKKGLLSLELLRQRKQLIGALAKVAHQGLFGSEDIRQYFDLEDITKYGASMEEVIGSGLMTGHLSATSDVYMQVEKILLKCEHLTLQEFLGALELSQMPLKDLEAISLSQNGKRDMVIQLSLGAMGDPQCQGLLTSLYPDTPIEDYNKKTARFLQTVWSSPRHYQQNGILYTIHCLSESKQLHMANQILQKSVNAFNALNLYYTIITPTDCFPLTDCLNNVSDPCSEVVLNGRLDPAGLHHIIQSKGSKGLTLFTDLTAKTLGVISKALSNNDTLSRLALAQSDTSPPLTTDDWAKFQPVHNTTLQGLWLQDIVNDDTVQAVCDKLHSLQDLQALALYSTLSDITPLSHIPKTIKYLTLATHGLDIIPASVVADIVLHNGLVWLNLTGNIGDSGAATLAQCMQDSHNVLQGLILQKCGITGSGVQVICDRLKGNTHLKVLDLSYNEVGERADALAETVCDSQIEEVNLHRCGISAAGGSRLLASLTYNSTLKCLDLYNNSLNTTDFANHVRNKLKNNNNMQALGLGGCGIIDDSLRIIIEGLVQNDRLRGLDLNDNPSLTCTSIRELFTNTQLQVLSVAGCELGREGWQQIGKALYSNHHLKVIYVGDGDSKEEDLVGLLEELIHSPTSSQLEHLVLNADKHKLSSLICQLENTSNIKVSCTRFPPVVWMLSGLMWCNLPHDIRNWMHAAYTYTH